MKKRVIAPLAAAVLFVFLLSCCGKSGGEITTGQIGVIKDEEFGHIYIDKTIDEFNGLGFVPGDSVDIAFDNGMSFEDIPYYTGYYVPVGELLVCAYPGYPHVVIARNYGDSVWEEFELTEGATVTVTLNEAGRYLDEQELFAMEYSDNRADYDSDEIFANFRELKGGRLKDGLIYRSASPCDNQHGRAEYADKLAEEAGIRFVLNLSDNETKYASYVEAGDHDLEYYDSLNGEGNVMFLAMTANYRSEAFAKSLADGVFTMTVHDGPCLIHCVEGKDRTGFACALLLALADASFDEIVDDYMASFENYYGLNLDNDPDKFEAVEGNVNDFFCCMCGVEADTPVDTLDLKKGAEDYLRTGGLGDEQIFLIEDYLTQ
ncbi:MAG: tyrosine-protein phosphatase [Oscillospiraceae bacterium]|nr:tyrosine-protein phosphatase [Oscillospiraceae bacterium]